MVTGTEYTMSKFAYHTNHKTVSGILPGCAAIQRDLNKVENLAEDLHETQQGRNNPTHWPTFGLESSLAEKEGSVLVGTKSAMSQQ